MESSINRGTRSGQVLAIAGCTNSGKTTFAQALKDFLVERLGSVKVIPQDDFFMEKEKVNKIWRGESADPPFYYNYDCPTAIDSNSLLEAVFKARRSFDYVIIEGNLITELSDVLALCDQLVFLNVDKKTCSRRRNTRSYDPPDLPGYFEEVVWPVYSCHLKKALALARTDRRFSFLDVSSDSDQPNPEIIASLVHQFSDDILRISSDKLSVDEASEIINSPSCGASSIFIGTTRDTFGGKKVIRLDYECYDEMAYWELRKLCAKVRKACPSVERMTIFHRIGTVPVGEASVIIATASPHRREAIAATEMAINELKRTVPIWKKEIYEDGSCSWKENEECCRSSHSGNTSSVEKSRNANRKLFWLSK